MILDHSAPLDGRGVLANFFSRAFSKESCPQKRSSSATFCSSRAVGDTSAVSLAEECCFAALLELTPPAKQQPFGQLVLAAELGGSLLAALDLAAQVELELPRKSAR